MTPRHEPVAIVGIGCRFPGGADTAEAFWRLVRDGVDAITDIPEDRPELRALYDPRPGTPGRISCRQGGFLSRLELFDPAFFGISPREASVVDPQQRLLLETTWEALEDAGIVPAALAGRSVGVFVGMWTNEYEDRMFAASPNVDLYVTTGGGRYAASGRLSYNFDLRGPSLTLDTACSSSLVAVHLACQSLRAGECEMAVVGASNLLLTPQISVGYSRSRMLSPDGRCRFGDARASGYVRSEGVGVVVLQPLSRALAEGNRIHAVVCGSAVNNDGRSSGLLVAPGVEAQKAMLRRAYEDAGIDPASVGYVEAHGTGTGVGDPVELEALGAVLGAGRPVDQPCPVGSIKTNIGHAEAASGHGRVDQGRSVPRAPADTAQPPLRDPEPEDPLELATPAHRDAPRALGGTGGNPLVRSQLLRGDGHQRPPGAARGPARGQRACRGRARGAAAAAVGGDRARVARRRAGAPRLARRTWTSATALRRLLHGGRTPDAPRTPPRGRRPLTRRRRGRARGLPRGRTALRARLGPPSGRLEPARRLRVPGPGFPVARHGSPAASERTGVPRRHREL